ncbi:MAG: hypothetical protein HWE13_08505 [Gammaproteobacteria bacterium]|nr:hypothetical protein [Gammaproteobacteria bacterium]NVK88154.1 hypothetical protein [Gammaproteobacteria bacterium]
MILSVEMSLYPLKEGYLPDIQGFIDYLHSVADLYVKTNNMSTQVCGDYDVVMNLLTTGLKPIMAQQFKAILVCKFLNSDIREGQYAQ